MVVEYSQEANHVNAPQLGFFYPNSQGKFGLLGQEMFHPRAATGDER